MATIRRAASAGLRLGVLALYFIRPSRAERSRKRAARAQKWYSHAAKDLEFMADMAEIDAAFDVTVADGLETASAR